MISAREYTEIVICKRLNTPKPTDLIVDNSEFERIRNRLEKLINFMSHDNKIPGFDPEDLEGFFDMKIHQCLRKGVKFNNEFSGFAKSFESLIRDIKKMNDRCLQRTYKDPIDQCEFWNERGLKF